MWPLRATGPVGLREETWACPSSVMDTSSPIPRIPLSTSIWKGSDSERRLRTLTILLGASATAGRPSVNPAAPPANREVTELGANLGFTGEVGRAEAGLMTGRNLEAEGEGGRWTRPRDGDGGRRRDPLVSLLLLLRAAWPTCADAVSMVTACCWRTEQEETSPLAATTPVGADLTSAAGPAAALGWLVAIWDTAGRLPLPGRTGVPTW